MNLDTCTPAQKRSIEHMSGAMLISAGAGSGKTFTLTGRLAYALSKGADGGISSIDEVCAITFTEAAASEIKARVKQALRAEGLAEQALKVDSAWIGTIHEMCSRILRTHALELGLDPAFSVMNESEAKTVFEGSIQQALQEAAHSHDFDLLQEEYPLQSSNEKQATVASLLRDLFSAAAGVSKGLDALDAGPDAEPLGKLARDLLQAYREVLHDMQTWASGQRSLSKTMQENIEEAAAACSLLSSYIEAYSERGFPSAASSTNNKRYLYDEAKAFLRLADKCSFLKANVSNSLKPSINAFKQSYVHIYKEAMYAASLQVLKEFLLLARRSYELFALEKRRLSMLDFDDLLVLTLKAFRTYPTIAQRYEQRFKLVMIDEFQDTNQLQVDAISLISGSRFSRLCCVGDAQQSIYRFRGADVRVFAQHKKNMALLGEDALVVELAKNFRSHADILSFVDRVFSQKRVFGSSFMPLEPDTARKTVYCAHTPRIRLLLTSPEEKFQNIKKLKQCAARRIARQFAELRDAGHSPADMVLLLGVMGKAPLYAEALREEGFECVVSGGSVFSASEEVQVVKDLAKAVVNPADTQALAHVLQSGVFELSAKDLLDLATGIRRDGRTFRRDLDAGIAAALREDACEKTVFTPSARFAAELLRHAWNLLSENPLSTAVQYVLYASGLFGRLQTKGAEGIAQAANILKALHFLQDVEQRKAYAPANCAKVFSEELEVMKESPGALSGSAENAVRIMTIHASKGLEFPIVAVADFSSSYGKSSALTTHLSHSTLFVSLRLNNSRLDLKNTSKVDAMKSSSLDSGLLNSALEAGINYVCEHKGYRGSATQDGFTRALCRLEEEQELAEARRKLYVALTRASEALIISLESGVSGNYDEVTQDIKEAMCATDDFPEGRALLDYGGSEPAFFERQWVGPGESRPLTAVSEEEQNSLHCFDENKPPLYSSNEFEYFEAGKALARKRKKAASSIREHEIFSYTGLSSSMHTAQDLPTSAEGGFGSHERPSQDVSESALPSSKNTEGSVTESISGSGGASTAMSASESAEESAAMSATDLGTAFHRLAQCEVATRRIPDEGQLQKFGDIYRLSAPQQRRLSLACKRWFSSELFELSRSWPLRRAEVGFFIPFNGRYLEGEIDLLCTQNTQCSGSALVIDYKTGGSAAESLPVLYGKHLLQAQCYSYALLEKGFDEVEIVFVRVEHDKAFITMPNFKNDSLGGLEFLPENKGKASSGMYPRSSSELFGASPQQLRYCFSAADKDILGRSIENALY